MASDRNLEPHLVRHWVRWPSVFALLFLFNIPIRAADIFAELSPAVSQTVESSASNRASAHWQLLHLPGIGGERMVDQYFVRGLVLGLQSRHVQVESRIYDWTEDEDGLPALSDAKLHARESAVIARMIEQIRREHPHDFFLLTSHSGGAGMAAWALRQVPSDIHVDEWIMLAPAVSPYFDFSDSFSHVNDHIFSFNSQTDLVLGTGTRLFGTVDRVKTDAGGRIGFNRPLLGDPLQYAKFQNIPYNPLWLRYGNAGDHIGPMLSLFSRLVVAPTAIEERLTAAQLPTTLPTRR